MVSNVTSCFSAVAGSFFTGQSSKNNEEVSLIRKADLENHNKDGGFWTVIDGKVYDIKDFQAQSQSLTGNSILGKLEKLFIGIRCNKICQNTFEPNVLIRNRSRCQNKARSHCIFVFLPLQPSLQARSQWLLWKLLCSLRTPENQCRPSVWASTWRYRRSQYTFSSLILHDWFQFLIF